MENNPNPSPPHFHLHFHHSLSLNHLQKTHKRSLFALLSLLLLLLLSFNGFSTFSVHIPFPSKTSPEPASFSPEIVSRREESRKLVSLSSSNSLLYLVKEENPPQIPKTHLPLLRKSHSLAIVNDNFPNLKRKHKQVFKILKLGVQQGNFNFSIRVKEFFSKNSCKVRFFMTWISSLKSFGDREFYTIETLFNSHPNGCLVIVSNSMDSREGMKILKPFLVKGIHITAVSPDFNYLFKNTMAESWFSRLIRGNVDPGEVSLGQNLSNLLRLTLLYKFGGVYIDTDVIVLKSFEKMKNAIGAQTIDQETKNWSRLNNAIMVFDKGHPLVYKFIEEFAKTFNGNKWGHNGPYLVSRVVERLNGRPGYNFTVMPPMAFYPVNWDRVRNLFRGARNETDAKWLRLKLRQIRSESYTVHLWNKQSRGLKVEEGSIIGKIISDCCIFCNSSALPL